MIMLVLLVLTVLLSTARLTYGNDIICEASARKACAGTAGVSQYLPSQEPASVQAGCFVIPDSQATTEAQRALMRSPSTHAGALFPQHYPCYLKVVDGLGVEMTLAEKQAVDAAQQVVVTTNTEKANELANNDFCNNLDKATIQAKMLTITNAGLADIAGLDALESGAQGIPSVVDVATTRAFLLRMNNANQATLTALHNRNMAGFEQLAFCLWARTR